MRRSLERRGQQSLDNYGPVNSKVAPKRPLTSMNAQQPVKLHYQYLNNFNRPDANSREDALYINTTTTTSVESL
jgi:hypothetical protein